MRYMIKKGLYVILMIIVSGGSLRAQIPEYRKITWTKERIAPGLFLKSSHALIYDSIPQNINVLFVNTRRREASISYSPRKNTIVSIQASSSGALAAVNGGFFNIQSNGSVSYIRVNGLITEPDTANTWNKRINMTGCILIGSDGKVVVERNMGNKWYDDHPEYKDVLVTGPLLIFKRKKEVLPETQLVSMKHPRTAAGTRGSRKLILITVDGRSDSSHGLTLYELTDLMKSLRIRNGVNLDGGGSTTMWMSGKPFNGVVNMPSDNRKFDHEGERPVANIIIVR